MPLSKEEGSPVSHLYDVYSTVRTYEVISLNSLQLLMRTRGLNNRVTRKAADILLEGGFLYSPRPNVFSVLHLGD